MADIDACRIWGSGYNAAGHTLNEPSLVIVEDSPRAGGGYRAGGNTKVYLERLNDKGRARLTTWLVGQRLIGIDQPLLTKDVIENASRNRPLPVHERAIRLLRYFLKQSEIVGQKVELGFEGNRVRGKWEPSTPHSIWNAMAWSDSIDKTELGYFIDYLERRGWITAERLNTGFEAEVTIEGYSHIADLETNLDSSQAFVAMWFDESMEKAYEQGIKLGIKDAGYKPLRIDRKDHINKIEDEIIAEIRRSRFLVSDFSQGDGGARGGVYYEAGFAHGLGLPVIFTCNTECQKELHFDTSHYNHIFWTTPKELRENLKNRILAVMGEGPVRNGDE